MKPRRNPMHNEKTATKLWQAHRLEGKAKNIGTMKKKKPRTTQRKKSK